MGIQIVTVHHTHTSWLKLLLPRPRRLPPARPSSSTSWPTTRSMLPRLLSVFVWLLRRWLLARRELGVSSCPPRSPRLRSLRSRRQRSPRLRNLRPLRSQLLRRQRSQLLKRPLRNQLPGSPLQRNLLQRKLLSQRRHKLKRAFHLDYIGPF